MAKTLTILFAMFLITPRSLDYMVMMDSCFSTVMLQRELQEFEERWKEYLDK